MKSTVFGSEQLRAGIVVGWVGDICVVVQEADGFARYLLLARPQRDGEPSVLLESGCEQDLAAAKRRAEHRAAWLGMPAAAQTHRREFR